MGTPTRNIGAVYRKSVHPQKVAPPLKPAPDLQHEFHNLDGGKVVLEKDVAIPTRDGISLYADVYRPNPSLFDKTPSLVFFAPFGKHGAVPREKFANMGIDFSKLSKYTHWELPDPLQWCGEWGYSFVLVDPRGTWWSEGGEANFFSPEEGRDGYDVVEWIARQPWSTGSIGWGGVSYYAMSAYQTAILKPPHLKAIMPWEGISDIYREVNAVGGIPCVPFQQFWMDMTGNGLGNSEDHATSCLEHPLFDEWWQSKVVDWSRIEVPAFSVTGWSSLGLHLRGTIAAWKKFSSANKYLQVHGDREWSEYYKEHNVQKQLQFWDRFLKNIPNEVDEWPAVTIDVRKTASERVQRLGTDFPPKATITKYFVADNQLVELSGDVQFTPRYVSFQAHQSDDVVSFDYKFEKQVEITGYSSAKLFVQCRNYPDVDLYVALQKLDKDGKEVKFYHSTQQIEASASFGWLRASHRELDTEASIPERPVHSHKRRQWLRPCDIVEAQIELWPSSTIWEAGTTMRLAVKGSNFTNSLNPTQFKSPSHGYGEVRVWFGGQYDSSLLVPIVADD